MIDFLRNDLFRRVTNGTTSTTTVGPETGKDGAKFTLLKTRERKTIQKKVYWRESNENPQVQNSG